MKIKKGDFIELDYTAKVVDEDAVFDTTNPKIAKQAGLIHDHDHDHEHEHHDHMHEEDFKPIVICVGEAQVLPGLDVKLEGLEIGNHSITLGEQDAFGKKDSKLLKLIPLSVFKKENIRPFVGLTLDVDNSRGVVRSVSGGRVIVDFNHPLAGKEVKYEVEIKRMIEDKKEQIEGLLELTKLPYDSINLEEKKAVINIKNVGIPEQMIKGFAEDISRMTGLQAEFKIEAVAEDKKEKSNDKV